MASRHGDSPPLPGSHNIDPHPVAAALVVVVSNHASGFLEDSLGRAFVDLTVAGTTSRSVPSVPTSWFAPSRKNASSRPSLVAIARICLSRSCFFLTFRQDRRLVEAMEIASQAC